MLDLPFLNQKWQNCFANLFQYTILLLMKKLLCILPTEKGMLGLSPPLLWHPGACKPSWCSHKCSPPAGVGRLVGVLSSECTCRCLAVCGVSTFPRFGGLDESKTHSWLQHGKDPLNYNNQFSFHRGRCIHLPLRALHMEEMPSSLLWTVHFKCCIVVFWSMRMEYHQMYVFAKYFWDVCHTKGFWSQCLSQPIINLLNDH